MVGEIVEISRTGAELLIEWRIQIDYLVLRINTLKLSPKFIFGGAFWHLRVRLVGGRLKGLGLRILSDPGPLLTQTLRVSVGYRGPTGVEMAKEEERKIVVSGGEQFVEDICLDSQLAQQQFRVMQDAVVNIRCGIKLHGAATGKEKFLGGARARRARPLPTALEVDILQKSEQSMLKSRQDSEATLKEQGMEELSESLQRLLACGEDSDCLIKVQDKEFPAHRAILRARSPVFRAMFAHDMLEKQSRVVTMEDCDQEMFPAFLEHIYTGSVEMISSGNVFGLYSAAEKYDLKILKKACAEFVKQNLTVASFCHTITLAVKHDDKELIERATEFFCSNTLAVVKTAEWQTFIAENPTIGNELHIKQLTK